MATLGDIFKPKTGSLCYFWKIHKLCESELFFKVMGSGLTEDIIAFMVFAHH